MSARRDILGGTVCLDDMIFIALLLGPRRLILKGYIVKIGELAAATQTQVETIRYYEREGLLVQAPRSEGNYRIYGPEHVERLAFIRHCRSLDMTLDEIRVLLRFKDSPRENCSDVNALLEEHIEHVSARIRELRTLKKKLTTLRAQCVMDPYVASCGIISCLSQPVGTIAPAAMRPATHPAGSHGTHIATQATAARRNRASKN